MALQVNSFSTKALALSSAQGTVDGQETLNFYDENGVHGVIFGSNPTGFAGVTTSEVAMTDHLIDGKDVDSEKIDFKSGNDVVVTINKAELEGILDASYEPLITNKGTAFNKNFGTGADEVVSGDRVLTDVPDDAVFTDTLYTKPASEPISYIDGLQDALDDKVDDSQVLTNVPVDAVFTDTVYEKPTEEPIGYITNLQASLDAKVESVDLFNAAGDKIKDTLLPAAASSNIQPDWAETDDTAGAYINNKPDFAALEARVTALEANKVDKEVGKGLSTNDLTDELMTKYGVNVDTSFKWWTTTDYSNKTFYLDNYTKFKISKQKDHFFLRLDDSATIESTTARVVVVTWNVGAGGDWAKNYTINKTKWGHKSPFTYGTFNDLEIEKSRPCHILIDTDYAMFEVLIHKFDNSERLCFQVKRHDKGVMV